MPEVFVPSDLVVEAFPTVCFDGLSLMVPAARCGICVELGPVGGGDAFLGYLR